LLVLSEETELRARLIEFLLQQLLVRAMFAELSLGGAKLLLARPLTLGKLP